MLRNPWKRCCNRRSGPTLLCSSLTSLFHSGTCVEGNPERRRIIEEDPSLQISHPWPEWVQLIKWLLHKGYFLHDEGNVFRNTALGAKDCNAIRTACLNFGRDHFHILR
ncbi:hypothetical protein V8G54_015790 [Vigna mungo]|uniref:Uncharacterized protein n=1 Tax=Vigna mungo TaxID=3915 RepID=A0AAQ3NLR3_VIGMU